MNDEQIKAFIARRAAQRPIENRRVRMAVLETAMDKAIQQIRISTAQVMLQEQFSIPIIAQITKLSVEEITFLSQGKTLDEEDDDTED
jgi:hypothetical protein